MFSTPPYILVGGMIFKDPIMGGLVDPTCQSPTNHSLVASFQNPDQAWQNGHQKLRLGKVIKIEKPSKMLIFLFLRNVECTKDSWTILVSTIFMVQ